MRSRDCLHSEIMYEGGPEGGKLISLREMEFLSALARRKHFARAAEDCDVSQPAFSMRIRKIEEKLDTAIVKRGNRFQGFTAEGEALVRHVRKILKDVKLLEQEFFSARGDVTGQLSVGVVPTAVIFSARAVRLLREMHPGIVVKIQTTTSLSVQLGLENGVFDVGITYGEGVSDDLMRVEDLYRETYYLLVPRRLAPRTMGEVTWAEAAELPLSLLEPEMQNRRIMDRVFGELGLSPKVVTESSGFIAAMVFAAEGMSATVVPEAFVEMMSSSIGDVVALRLTQPRLEKVVSAVTLIRDPDLPAVTAMREVLASI